jgi:hypothetical protein
MQTLQPGTPNVTIVPVVGVMPIVRIMPVMPVVTIGRIGMTKGFLIIAHTHNRLHFSGPLAIASKR